MENFNITTNDISSVASVSREMNGLINDRLMTERSIKSQQDKWSTMLNGTLGKDIDGVLNGKIKVKLPLSLKIKYWLNNLLNNISRII